ncbi:hypothetical protein GALMADRAFT_1181105 [Galerina marginata CBS 339.88]|uniref:Uncharacterized protein n=1 Tax=Galerina marginata (strain CBS 339.88) TaxID=685588 RepID=A0A067TAA4_GALM3|nr:hypothetical protein GALMADRAFT_1181105 [Galerina marginata CBS 339.88]
MSAPAADSPRVVLEKSIISSALNSSILLIFLMGIYTMVYFGSLYQYLSRRGSQRRYIITSITLLYLFALCQTGIQWYNLDFMFVEKGGTRESILASISTTPPWIILLSYTCTSFTLVLADGILVWRCFFVWNRSLRVILLPLVFLFAEIVLSITTMILVGEFNFHAKFVTLEQAVLVNRVQAALFFVSFASSLATTMLIAYRIHSVSKLDCVSWGRFRHIIEIVVQSAAITSLALLLQAIPSALAFFPSNLAIITLYNYGPALAIPITGLAPTVMVARVCGAADTSTHLSTIHRLSGLQFQGQSTTYNGTQIRTGNMHEVDADSILNQEGKAGMV